MYPFMLVIHTMSSILLLVVILLQPSRSGGVSGMLGGGGTSFFGGKGAAPFLIKVTVVLASVFLLCSVTLTRMAGRATRGEFAVERALEDGEFGGWPIPPDREVMIDPDE